MGMRACCKPCKSCYSNCNLCKQEESATGQLPGTAPKRRRCAASCVLLTGKIRLNFEPLIALERILHYGRSKRLSRRDFLKATGLSVVPLAVQHLPPFASRASPRRRAVHVDVVQKAGRIPDPRCGIPTNPTPIRRSPTPSIPTRRISAGADLGVPACRGGYLRAARLRHRNGLAGQTSTSTALRRRFHVPFFPATRPSSRQATQYALGWMAQTFGFFYNPALFEPPADQPPETWTS